jgi:hypothetical protein
MKVTSLGSCRQHSLQQHFPVTQIQERLTYPHYTKEILQAIEFCKGVSAIPGPLTQSLFRTGILEQRSLDPRQFKEEFESTDVFVVEIASRLAYPYKGFYAHHILTEPQYGSQTIEIYTQSDEEIEADLLRIRDLLAPKPLLIVSHIYTRTTGRRYTLVRLLERLCSKHKIPFLDPMACLSLPYDLLFELDESHYTTLGHQKIGNCYKIVLSHKILK